MNLDSLGCHRLWSHHALRLGDVDVDINVDSVDNIEVDVEAVIDKASFSVQSEVAIDGVGDLLAVTPKLLTPVVEFWLVVENLKGEPLINLFANKLSLPTIKLSRACSALFNRHDRTTDGDMFCSENRTGLDAMGMIG